MVRKLFLLMMAFLLLLSSSYAHENAGYENYPNLTSWNPETGVGEVKAIVNTGGENLLTFSIELIHETEGVINLYTVTDLTDGQTVTYNFDLTTLGNYNGEYFLRGLVLNQDEPSQNELAPDINFTYSAGIDLEGPIEGQRFIGVINVIEDGFSIINITLGETIKLLMGNFLLLIVCVTIVGTFTSIFYLVLRYIPDPSSYFFKKK